MVVVHYGLSISYTLLLEPNASKHLCTGDSFAVVFILAGEKYSDRGCFDCFRDGCLSMRLVAALGVYWVVVAFSARIVYT